MAQQEKPRLPRSEAAFRRLAAQHAATQALISGLTRSEVLAAMLRGVCEALNWDEAAFWWVDRATNVLRCEEFWRAAKSKAVTFETVTREITFQPGVGLPGRVWETGMSTWIPDVVK